MHSSFSNSFISRQMRPKRRNSFITVAILGCIITVFLLAYHSFGSAVVAEPSLIQLHVLFRHGERTPSSSFPTDPNKDHHWEEGFGALTNTGKYGMFCLGETLKARYSHFLGNLYVPDDISIKSSNAPRCQMSAMTFLAGFFPPKDNQIWNNDLLWQPIPVNPIPRNVDNLIACKAPCPAFDKEKLQSDESLSTNLTESDKSLFKYLSEKTGQFVANIENVETLYSILKIQEENGLKIPSWTKSVYPEPMKRMAAMNLASYTRTTTLKILQGGPLAKEWLDNMKGNEKKAYFYSGHDLTIVNLMSTMGFNSEFLPDYGAAFILELHHTSTARFVQAYYYNSSSSTTPLRLQLPGCDSDQCLLETLTSHLTPYLPKDWAEECKA